MDFFIKEKYNINDFLKIVSLLRDPLDGCPWDKEQTHFSIRQNAIEEVYEVCDAIDHENSKMLCEELGDLLLQILLHTQMEKEQNNFTFDDVCDGICKKLIYRHPHIFASSKVLDTEQVLQNWDKLKQTEKSLLTAKDNLQAVPLALPALMRSKKLQKRAEPYGFGYKKTSDAMADLDSEISELKVAIEDNSNIEDEIGDVIFSAVNVARMLKIDAEEALTKTSNKFMGRVIDCEQYCKQQNMRIEKLSCEQLDAVYKQVKRDRQG